MKVPIALFLAIVGTLRVQAVPVENEIYSSPKLLRALDQDIRDFIALIPEDTIHEIVLDYSISDKDFQETVEYILSDDFKSIVLQVESIHDVRVFLKYIHDSGLRIYNLMNVVHDFISLAHYVPLNRHQNLNRITGGLPGLIADIKAVLPIKEIKALYNHKLQTSSEFVELVKRLQSPEFQKVVDTVYSNPKFQVLIGKAEAKGVDVKAILNLITEILGIHFPNPNVNSITRGLIDDFKDFSDLIPQKQVEQIVQAYVTSDKDFQETVEYILSDDFKSIVLQVESIHDVKVFLKYIYDSGLRIYDLMNAVHDFLALDHYVPLNRRQDQNRITGGLPGLIADIKAVLPIEEIKNLYNYKLQTSPEFANLVKRLQSPEFQKVVDTVYSNPKFQVLIGKAEAKGVDVKAIFNLITEILGIHFPNPTIRSFITGLNEDFEDFLDLIPKKQVEEIVQEYITSDEDFQEAVEYVLSNEFKALVLEVESIEDVKVFVKYLSDSGLNIYTLLNQIHDFLGLEPLIPPLEQHETMKITGGLPGLIADIKTVLPVDEIKTLFKEKLETSPDFAALVQRLGSPEFQKIVDTVWVNQRLQELIGKANAKGVDVKAILNLITEIFGIHFPVRFITMGLPEDLQDFFNLVPREKIEEIILEYLSSDVDFQEAMDYVLSNEFKALVLEIEAIEDVKVFIKYLADSGLNVYSLLNEIHKLLELEPITPPIREYGILRITGGLPGLIADIKAILPVDKIKALYKDKLVTSSDFAALVQRLGSPEFQEIVNTVWANQRLQVAISKAEAKGVDVKAILSLITEILGIQFPAPQFRFIAPLHLNRERNLKDDLNDLLALIPVKEVIEIALEYLSVDEDFQVAMDYVLSSYIGNLILDIEAIEGVPAFLQYLSKAGLDVYTFLNKVHEIWNISSVLPPTRTLMLSGITGGIPGFIQDVLAVLPLEKIKALYRERLENSKPLQDLLQRIQSPEFQKMVDVLMANERLNDLMDKAEAKGLDVNTILAAISKLLGIKLPTRPSVRARTNVLANEALLQDFKDIAKLVPNRKITVIVMRYAVVDKDFKRVVKYMLSKDFQTLIRDVEATTEMKEFLKYLDEIGLNVYKWIRIFHKLIHMDTLKDTPLTRRITGGIPGLIQDIRAVLPLKELYALYDEKLENSPAFVEFVERLRSQELQNLINALAKNNEVQRLLNTLVSMGVPVDHIFKLLSDFFGITFPERPFY